MPYFMCTGTNITLNSKNTVLWRYLFILLNYNYIISLKLPLCTDSIAYNIIRLLSGMKSMKYIKNSKLCIYVMPFLNTICSIIFFKTDFGHLIAAELKSSKISFDNNHFLTLKTTVHALKLENTPKCLFLIVSMH